MKRRASYASYVEREIAAAGRLAALDVREELIRRNLTRIERNLRLLKWLVGATAAAVVFDVVLLVVKVA